MLNKNLLKSKMALFGDNGNSIAAALGITPQSFSGKINEKNGAEFTQKEIELMKQRYNLTNDEVIEIFFAD